MCFIFWPLIRKEHTVVDYFYFSAFGAPWSRIRRLTSFCSSIKKARTIFSRTALWLKTPPYALKTFFLRRDSLFLSAGLLGLIPFSLMPVMGHFGRAGLFLRYWNTNLPPGVRTFFLRFDLVL